MNYKAILPETRINNGEHYTNKAQIKCYIVVAMRGGEYAEPVTVRVWKNARAERVYASIWVQHTTLCAGTGFAGGGGYDKTSAAIGAAIESAGICIKSSETGLDADIGGRGDSAIRDALEAISKALGFDDIHIVTA